MAHAFIITCTELRIMRCYAWSVLLYGAEIWTISQSMKQRLEAYEAWLLRRMMRVSWKAKITNKKIFEMAGVNRSLILTIKKRQLRYFGHVVRHDSLQKTIMTGKIAGKRDRGRQRRKWTDGIAEWMGLAKQDIFHAAHDREGWRSRIADLRNGDGIL